MKLAITVLAGAAALALAGPAVAADKDKAQTKDPGFNVLDKNNDGKLSREEHAAAPEHASKAKSGSAGATGSSGASGSSGAVDLTNLGTSTCF